MGADSRLQGQKRKAVDVPSCPDNKCKKNAIIESTKANIEKLLNVTISQVMYNSKNQMHKVEVYLSNFI